MLLLSPLDDIQCLQLADETKFLLVGVIIHNFLFFLKVNCREKNHLPFNFFIQANRVGGGGIIFLQGTHNVVNMTEGWPISCQNNRVNKSPL